MITTIARSPSHSATASGVAAFPHETSAWFYAHYRPAYPDIVLDLLLNGPWFTPGGLVVDIGCGTGQLAIPLAARGARVVAIDPSRDMLAEGRARVSSLPEAARIRWVHGHGQGLMSLVDTGEPICLVVFGKSFHLTDRARMLDCCHHAIAPGGAVGVISGNWVHGGQPRWWDVVDNVLRGLAGDRESRETGASNREKDASVHEAGASERPAASPSPSLSSLPLGAPNPSHEDVLRASAFSNVSYTSLRISVIRGLAEVIGLIASIPGYSPVDLGVARFELLVSELHGRLRCECPDESFVEERTLDVRLAQSSGRC
jgi:SAM-dependent methyltransferase